jgi:glycerol uptake facilitator-like aquaporin
VLAVILRLKFSPLRIYTTGRISPSRLTVIIPAHFLGCVFGAVLFKVVCPIAPEATFEPVLYNGNQWLEGLLTEAFVVCLYVCVIIGVPELLAVNRMSPYLLSVPILPLLLVRVPDRCSTFNPAALYALWYISGNTAHPWSFQVEHLIGPILGSVLAGVICSRVFPDDPSCWKRNNGTA